MRGLRAFDAAQQRSRWLALPVAVVRKFFEDNGGQFAGLMAYYGFFSLFPLLLVLVTVLGLVLHGDTSLQHRIEDSSLAQFPIIGTQIRSHIKSLNGGVLPLAIGLAGAVWGGIPAKPQRQWLREIVVLQNLATHGRKKTRSRPVKI